MNTSLTATCIHEIVLKASIAAKNNQLVDAIKLLTFARNNFPKNPLIDGAYYHYTTTYAKRSLWSKLTINCNFVARSIFNFLENIHQCIVEMMQARSPAFAVALLALIGGGGAFAASTFSFQSTQLQPSFLSQTLGIDSEMLRKVAELSAPSAQNYHSIAVLKFFEMAANDPEDNIFKTSKLDTNDTMIQRGKKFGGSMIYTTLIVPSASERDAMDICKSVGINLCEPVMIDDLYSSK